MELASYKSSFYNLFRRKEIKVSIAYFSSFTDGILNIIIHKRRVDAIVSPSMALFFQIIAGCSWFPFHRPARRQNTRPS